MLTEALSAPHALLLGDGLHDAISLLGIRPSTTTIVSSTEVAAAQLERRFALVAVCVAEARDPGAHRSALHCAVQHLDRDGYLVVRHDGAVQPLCSGFRGDDLRPAGALATERWALTCFQRGHRTTVHDLLFEARSAISRVSADELSTLMAGDDPPLVLDTRTHTDRARFGVIPGSVHVPRTVVEWHLDPSNGYLHPAMRSFDQPIVLVCNGGYSSSLAAANLVRIGFTSVADLIGGHTAWCTAGLPVQVPDHSHLDIPAAEDPPINPAS